VNNHHENYSNIHDLKLEKVNQSIKEFNQCNYDYWGKRILIVLKIVKKMKILVSKIPN